MEGAADDRRRVGGIVTQIEDGATGYLVSSPQECAERALEILADPRRRPRDGAAGARSTFAATSSPRGCCETGSR